ncbi:hypothetical protein D8674_006165 [Pyrus ussuriensis x Pyrus communis]|uniref:Uncharacterized protein n=1 Tax=Pyrus ussuriensis x Pyrus communis TaxID=2448454 RepID=A0A5N5FTH7_9ROSA|nr:hypothetical protein D8674_006165 [Pyrus ussuriensis x Pyrus communis]
MKRILGRYGGCIKRRPTGNTIRATSLVVQLAISKRSKSSFGSEESSKKADLIGLDVAFINLSPTGLGDAANMNTDDKL